MNAARVMRSRVQFYTSSVRRWGAGLGRIGLRAKRCPGRGTAIGARGERDRAWRATNGSAGRFDAAGLSRREAATGSDAHSEALEMLSQRLSPTRTTAIVDTRQRLGLSSNTRRQVAAEIEHFAISRSLAETSLQRVGADVRIVSIQRASRKDSITS